MSDVINSIFGRPKNETPGSGGYGYGTSEPVAEVATEPADTEESEEATAEPTTDSAPETDSAEEIAEEFAEDEPTVAETEDTAEAVETEDDLVEDEDRVAEPATEPVTEPVVTEPAVAEAAPVAEETEPVVAEAEETEPVVAEAEAIVAEAEPLVAAETRPAAGSRGSTTVADGVVVKLVTRVAAKAEGVHELDEAGISVDVDGEVVTIAITLVVEFGRAVKELAEQIRIKLIEAVEQYLGLEVAIVDVHVADIHFPETD